MLTNYAPLEEWNSLGFWNRMTSGLQDFRTSGLQRAHSPVRALESTFDQYWPNIFFTQIEHISV
jgi:hypothetical protein